MDLDGDGNNDILSGSYSRMEQPMAGLFQILRGNDDCSFQTAEVLKGNDGEPLIIPVDVDDRQQMTLNICTRPTACDWDNDGDLDLVVGNFAGSFYVFSGDGNHSFDPVPTQLMAGGAPLAISGVHSDPFIVDWDGDGDLDLLSGSSQGGVYWSENTAGEMEVPELTEFKTLIAPPTVDYNAILLEEDLTGPTTGTRIWVDDINGDGKLDILVGDNTTLLAPAKEMSAEEFEKAQIEWNARMQELSQQLFELRSDEDTEAADRVNRQMMEHYQARAELIKEERTGFVWLFVRK